LVESVVEYVSGVEQSREIISETVVASPVTEIVERGIGFKLGALTDTNLPSFRYREAMVMNASAYTAGFGCTGKHPCDPWYGITASGRRVEHGIVAVDPAVIPLGTLLYVEGYGFSIAADVGGAIRGHKIDLFMHELHDALRFGRRNINVWVLD
jgi:3D (Asp-Asp-Asp) domain-containing protein